MKQVRMRQVLRCARSHGAPGWIAVLALGALVSVVQGYDDVVKPAVPALAPTAAPAPVSSDPAILLDQKVIKEIGDHSEILSNLTYLSDMIGPRLTGSAALKRANDWTAERMKSYGLENVHLEPWTIPVGWERGTATARIVEPENGRTLLLASMGWTPGTKGKVTGDVVILKARTTAELASFKGKLKDAIVLMGQPSNPDATGNFGQRRRPADGAAPANPGAAPANLGVVPASPAPAAKDAPKEPARETAKDAKKPAEEPQPPPRPDRGNFGQMRAFQRELNEFLRNEGAAVTLRDAGKPQSLLTTTGGWRGEDRTAESDAMPAAFVAHEHYALLYRLASRPAPARTRVEIEITNKMIPGPLTVYNTVGEIRGTEKPDEFVVLGAHLDSWDLAQGTTDNGTGSMVVLEAARALVKSEVKPRRTIRFVLFSGEEEGLYGSKAYVQAHKAEMAKTSMCIAHDTGTGKVTGLGLQNREVLKPLFEKELVSLKDLGVTDINLRSMGGTDHLSFEQAGVPGFAVQQDMNGYNLTHHSQSDTLDKAREPDLKQGAQVMAIAGLRVANLPQLLPRDKKESPRGGLGGGQ